MLASEKMAQRVVLVARLEEIDTKLIEALAKPASNRVSSNARTHLRHRRDVCAKLEAVGYAPWPIPVDERETKIS